MCCIFSLLYKEEVSYDDAGLTLSDSDMHQPRTKRTVASVNVADYCTLTSEQIGTEHVDLKCQNLILI